MIAINVAINDTRDHWSITVDLHLAFIESVTTSNTEFADKKKASFSLDLTLFVHTVRNLTRRPEARDAVVKTIRYNRRNCGPIRCLGNSRWYISIYPPASLPFISRGPRNVRTIYAVHDCRRRAKDTRHIGRCMRKKNQSLSGKMISNGRESRNRMLMYP